MSKFRKYDWKFAIGAILIPVMLFLVDSYISENERIAIEDSPNSIVDSSKTTIDNSGALNPVTILNEKSQESMDNSDRQNTQKPESSGSTAIRVQGIKNAEITGNVIRGFDTGIVAEDVENLTAKDNDVQK